MGKAYRDAWRALPEARRKRILVQNRARRHQKPTSRASSPPAWQGRGWRQIRRVGHGGILVVARFLLADPDVPMDTNHLERALGVIPMGQKNWLFCWTEIGAKKVGQFQSLIAICVLRDLDPYMYLVDVLQRIDTHPQS
jgi:hypothetical protein